MSGSSLPPGTQVGKWCKQLKIKNLKTYRLCVSLQCNKKILHFWCTSVSVDLCCFFLLIWYIHCSFSFYQNSQDTRNLAQPLALFTYDFSLIQLLTGWLKICVFPKLAIIIEISSQELINLIMLPVMLSCL